MTKPEITTLHQISDQIVNGTNMAMVDLNRDAFVSRIQQALSDERERCASIARSLGHEQCVVAIEMGATLQPTRRK